MRIEKISHVAICVRDLEKASRFFADLLDTEFAYLGEYKELDLRNIMSPLGIELVEPLTPDGMMAKVLDQRGEGLACLALKVSNLEEAIAKMTSRGLRLMSRSEKGGFNAAVFHPKDTFGVLIELTEYKTKHPVVSALQ